MVSFKRRRSTPRPHSRPQPLALKFWSTRHFVKGPGKRAVLEVEVDRPARLIVAVKMSTLLDWLYTRKPKTPEEATRIQRMRGLLADDRH
jgi:hypothetical protein